MTTLDLHGMTLAEAHATTNAFLAHCHERSVTIVTGISGAIHREFPHWLDKHPIGRIEPMNGGGAFRVHLRRRRQSIESKVQTILKDWEAK
jgi:DNA-nicking Smr family endonuclease